MLSFTSFYKEYHGHRVSDLEVLVQALPQGRGVLYLLGDSTLDNKVWLNSIKAAVNGYVERAPKTAVAL